mmetsp:Transcript_4773/g.8196  ORF Transcript_4773/g.8196 Transcript_4773/m.8196 type:complete len:370 (-) Transcript_4773:105-1214(-)
MSSSTTSSADISLAIGSYVFCSSVALVANKVVMTYLHAPGLVFCLQLAVTVAFIRIGGCAGLIEVDSLSYHNLKIFAPYMCSFTISLYSNGRALSAANIETVIVFRACSPLFVSILDWVFLGRELPGTRSALSLLGVVAGAVGYVLADGQFAMNGFAAYTWVMLNLTGIVFEMTYGKYLISGVTFKSPVWGATLYTNTLAILPMFTLAAAAGERKKLDDAILSNSGVAWLVLSCIVGVGISWSGWNCRQKVSATVYTLLGVACKFISVTLNIMIWDKHATRTGLAALSICLVSSSLYRQAPLREQGAQSNNSIVVQAELKQMKVQEEEKQNLVELDHKQASERTRVPTTSMPLGQQLPPARAGDEVRSS